MMEKILPKGASLKKLRIGIPLEQKGSGITVGAIKLTLQNVSQTL